MSVIIAVNSQGHPPEFCWTLRAGAAPWATLNAACRCHFMLWGRFQYILDPKELSERQYPWGFCVSKGWVRNVHPKGESAVWSCLGLMFSQHLGQFVLYYPWYHVPTHPALCLGTSVPRQKKKEKKKVFKQIFKVPHGHIRVPI